VTTVICCCCCVKLHWKVEGLDASSASASDDLSPTSGSVMLLHGESDGQLSLSIVADELSELDEQFIVTLFGVDGGADIDTALQFSSFTVRYTYLDSSSQFSI